MFGIVNFEAFIIAGILLNLTPGADTMYILGRSISQGKKTGIISVLGISSGALLHCIFAVMGLSILLAKSATAFNAIKYIGAAYLIFLGIKSLTTKSTLGNIILQKNKTTQNYKKIYLSGVLTNLLNPKIALFFLAFLPQFISPEHATNAIPFLILGLTFVTTGTIWCLTLAVFSAKLASTIKQNRKVNSWLNKTTGVLFIVLGIQLALNKK
ncbi:LysE family translocator [Aquimarina sediminis]|uniref:LysE family translocator n=1 Tax=Aquimarina sediminis TaxID=2070536 RepID=UPI000CA06C4F|nr:LysE family translocator [Aquimarina sediminis]